MDGTRLDSLPLLIKVAATMAFGLPARFGGRAPQA